MAGEGRDSRRSVVIASPDGLLLVVLVPVSCEATASVAARSQMKQKRGEIRKEDTVAFTACFADWRCLVAFEW